VRSGPVIATVIPAAVIAASWLRLEEPRHVPQAAAVVALALVPALLRPWWARALAAIGGALVTIWLAFSAPPWDIVLQRSIWWERLGNAAGTGLRDFNQVFVPFDSVERWELHGLVLLAIFVLTLGIGLCVAVGRPLWGVAIVLVGAGVPTTLLEERVGIAAGAVVLAACLWLVAASSARVGRGNLGTVVVGVALVALAAAAAGAGGVPDKAAVDWKSWELFARSNGQVGLGYVWEAHYDGIRFPPKPTTVLRVRGTRNAYYWRASTLDDFDGVRWREYLYPLGIRRPQGRLPLDALLPAAAYAKRRWVKQEVEIVALRSDRLPAASTPVALASSSFGQVALLSGGVLGYANGLKPGQRYTVWSFAPHPGPAQLRASRATYPENVDRYLTISGANLPGYGVSDRNSIVDGLISSRYHTDLAVYRPVWAQAQRLTRGAGTPYEAALALERWFRSQGGFTYAEQPPRPAGLPPLADFVLRGKRGYCQHFAGAMTLMLRFLGVPARVAVGFTGGSFHDGVWTVTDHDAHAWVEVWFDGWGWLPFDPTPGRGALSQTYTVASSSAAAAIRLGGRPFIPQGQAPALPGSTSAGAEGSSDPRATWAAAGLAALVLALLGGIGLAKLVRRHGRYRTDDPRRLASAARADLADRLRDQGIVLPAPATLADVTRALQRVGLTGSRFAAAAARARYGPPEGALAAAADARRELRSLVRALRTSLPVRRRVRGFVSLRSLRAP
jgi:transglutaminase-like putative cysteine protease